MGREGSACVQGRDSPHITGYFRLALSRPRSVSATSVSSHSRSQTPVWECSSLGNSVPLFKTCLREWISRSRGVHARKAADETLARPAIRRQPNGTEFRRARRSQTGAWEPEEFYLPSFDATTKSSDPVFEPSNLQASGSAGLRNSNESASICDLSPSAITPDTRMLSS